MKSSSCRHQDILGLEYTEMIIHRSIQTSYKMEKLTLEAKHWLLIAFKAKSLLRFSSDLQFLDCFWKWSQMSNYPSGILWLVNIITVIWFQTLVWWWCDDGLDQCVLLIWYKISRWMFTPGLCKSRGPGKKIMIRVLHHSNTALKGPIN